MSKIIKVNLKWGKQKFENIELNLDEPPSIFKGQVYTLTGVLPERQKIMIKGGILKDDSDWNKLNIQNGYTFMMMGSVETDIPKEPETKTIFMEDLSSDQVLSLETEFPVGLRNLGNTCYMNSTIQCLKSIPELNKILKKYPNMEKKEGDGAHNITIGIKSLFEELNHSVQDVSPYLFLTTLREVFPQFAQKGPNGFYMQQDAEECWSQIISCLNQKLPQVKSKDELDNSTFISTTNSAITQLFSGEITSTISNTECPEEEKVIRKDSFLKLECHISNNINYLKDGLKESFEEYMTKRSEKLGRDSKYLKLSKISKLPYYLTIQFVRFFWNQGHKIKAKIVKPVEFPLILDLYDFCTDELKESMTLKRKQLQQMDEYKYEEERKKKKEKEKQSFKKIKKEKEDIILDPLKFKNETGMYELIAVLTHRGRMADSGHYVSWVKQGSDEWLKFDDDKLSIVNDEEIKKLSGKGGADWHIAYLCIYQSKNVDVIELEKIQKELQNLKKE